MTVQETRTIATQPSLKERQRQERAALILKAAEAVLAEKGYHETSIDEIAARVGIAKGTVYLHFSSKEQLVLALFEEEVANFQQAVAQIIDQPGPARTQLEAILRLAYEGMRGQRTRLFLTLYASMSLPSGPFAARESLRDHVELLRAHIRAVLVRGQDVGEFDPTIPTEVMLTTFFALLSPRGYRRLLDEVQISPDDLVSYVGRVFFHGIAREALEER